MVAALAAGAGVIAFGGASRPVEAHRAHVSLTRVLANPRTGTWEFQHSIHTHDTITALTAWLPGEEPNPASDRARARVALEVERRISWTGPDGRTLAPIMVGAELAGDDIVVYQELPAPRVSGAYSVTCELLHGIFADQRNVVQFGVVTPPVVARLDARRNRASFDWRP
ncbi:MAG: DUF6702 family protein [Gammaproteobacteria bacterium]